MDLDQQWQKKKKKKSMLLSNNAITSKSATDNIISTRMLLCSYLKKKKLHESETRTNKGKDLSQMTIFYYERFIPIISNCKLGVFIRSTLNFVLKIKVHSGKALEIVRVI